MTKDNELYRYINFPIVLLGGLFTGEVDRQSIMDSIFYYGALYHTKYVLKEMDWHEYDLQKFQDSVKYLDVGNLLGKMGADDLKYAEDMTESLSKAKVFVGLNAFVWHDYMTEEKTDREWKYLTAFLALKSIVGTDPVQPVTNNYWFTRMAGLEKIKKIKDEKIKLPEGMSEYGTNNNKKIYWSRIFRKELEKNWRVVFEAGTRKNPMRGFYASLKMNQEEIINYVAMQRIKKEIEEAKKENEKEKLRQKANEKARQFLEQIRNQQTPPI